MKKTETKKWIRLSVILYIVIITVVAVVTLAWFVFDETASLQTGTEMKITAGSKLEISWYDPNGGGDGIPEYTKYGSNFTINLPPASYPDISGDGVNFYCPKALDENDKTMNSLYGSFYTPEDINKNPDLYYITVELKFKTTLPMDVYLSKNSYVSGRSDVLVGERADNTISNGKDISRDAISGAVRVAFIERDTLTDRGDVLKNVWIPNYKHQLTLDAAGEVVDFTENGASEIWSNDYPVGYLTEGGVVDGKQTVAHYSYQAQQYYEGAVTVGTNALAEMTNSGVPMANNATALLSFSENDIKAAGYAEKTLFIKIWVEGTDREADKAFIDGLLKYKFDFIGIQTKDEFTPNISVTEILPESFIVKDNVLCNSNGTPIDQATLEKYPILYSFNAYEWEKYNNQFVTQQGQTLPSVIYVRYAEGINTKASRAYIVTDIS